MSGHRCREQFPTCGRSAVAREHGFDRLVDAEEDGATDRDPGHPRSYSCKYKLYVKFNQENVPVPASKKFPRYRILYVQEVVTQPKILNQNILSDLIHVT